MASAALFASQPTTSENNGRADASWTNASAGNGNDRTGYVRFEITKRLCYFPFPFVSLSLSRYIVHGGTLGLAHFRFIAPSCFPSFRKLLLGLVSL